MVFDYSNEDFLLNSNQEIEHNAGESNVTLSELDSLVSDLTMNLKERFTMAIEGFKYEEIAETIGITQNNVRVRMNRIREKLRNLMT